ncbi:hypothetical protein LCGC14_2225170 [marine sediment metagenome]|uniref:NBD domain-containing protein n=1 Tax=marine sediment metagenome TaxID=412755 RepID=A0A0F9G5B5_9ZZZZ
MFDKRAQFNLINVEVLNAPEFMIKAARAADSFIKDQQIIPDPASLQLVIEKIALSSKESSEEKSGDGENAPAFHLQAEIDFFLFGRCSFFADSARGKLKLPGGYPGGRPGQHL